MSCSLNVCFSQIIHTVIGNNIGTFSGDGGLATSASVYYPGGTAVDMVGNIFIADTYNNRVRKINTAGIVSTIAGNGTAGFSGDGGAAVNASLSGPADVAVSSDGSIYIADEGNQRIRKVSISGIITTIAGVGPSGGYVGDNGPATSAGFGSLQGIAIDINGNILIADRTFSRIRKISNGIITTIAGNGSIGFAGDGGIATAAILNLPTDIAVDNAGNIFIADFGNYRVRKVGTNGIITTIAGNGTYNFSGDGGLATSASLKAPAGVAIDNAGNIYIGDMFNNRIRKVNTSNIISTLAGTGAANFGGDGGNATSAQLNSPTRVSISPDQNLYISDNGNHRIRRVSFTPTITSFTPASGGLGSEIIIAGTYLGNASSVKFGGTEALNYNVNSGINISAIVSGGTTGSISVVTPGGTATKTGFTFIPAPTISSFTPTSANVGQTVTINGTFPGTVLGVSFGGVPAQSFTSTSTSISAVVGVGLSGEVSVTTNGGTASKSGFTIPNPTITSFTPTTAPVGGTVTITGTNLSGASSVTFGGKAAASYTVLSNTSISAVVGQGFTGPVVVVTPNGTATKTGFVIATPSITSFSPTSGNSGTVVSITGNNLSGATGVTFGGVNAGFGVTSNTSITATVGAGATGNVNVTTPGGTASLAGFTFTGPTISSFTPASTYNGSTVTITGTNFTGATAVKFGNVDAASFTVISPTSISAIVGLGASGFVSVTTPLGIANLAGFTYSGPLISSFSPASTGSGLPVIIAGSNFTGVAGVSFGGVPATSFTVNSPTQISAVVGAGASGNVEVFTSHGEAVKSGFTYIAGPVISSFNPTSAGSGILVTISGSNFTGASSVKFGNTNASSFTVVNSSAITATVASGSTGSVTVTTPGGTGNLAGFTYVSAPTLTGHTPTSAGSGTVVTLTGTNLTNASSVSFGGIPASSFTMVSATSITATVGAGASGNIVVVTPGGTATRGGFTYIPAPVISSFTPTTATVLSTITINGSNFTGATDVRFGGVTASGFSVSGSTQIIANAAAGSASGAVSVTTAGGTATLGGFTFIPPPVISSFTPTSATAGTVVTINGSNFNSITAVRFGGTNAVSYTVVSPTQITAVVGSGSSGSISVTSSNGTGSLAGFLHTSITSFSPTSATIGATVAIYGPNLTGATAVSFGGVPATSHYNVSSSQVNAVVGNGATGTILVTTPAGTVSATGTFTYIVPTPVITSFSPASATNRDVVTITGNYFSGATAVKFGGVNAYSFTVLNNNTISAIVAHGASGNVSVTTPGGTANLAGFTYVPSPPTISNFSPSSTCSTGTVVTIRGLNFTGTTAVQFGGVNMAYTLLSDTVITVTTTAVNNSGVITVTTPYGSATTSAGFVMGSGVPAFLPNPNPFQLCAGNPRLLNTNLAGAYNYVCSNGQSGNAITISSPGSYTLTATDEYGCSNSANFTVTNYSNCGGYLEIESEPVFNYFDTLTVKIRIKNGVNIFSTFAYLNFNPSHLKYVSSTPGNYLGSNVLFQPPVIIGGQIDFGMSHITGDPGTYGDGLIYEFKFVLADQIPDLASFNAIKPNSFTTNLTLSNLSIYDATGIQPPSFPAISMLQKPVACRYYVPVWPGDLNFDRKVNVADITPIGYFYGATGPVRPNASIFWTAQPSQLWGFDKSAKNKSAYRTFADGTPDGVINLADQSSIGFNLNKFRLNNVEPSFVMPVQHTDPNLPPLKIDLPSTQIPLASLPSNEVATFTLGTPSLPLNNVYGLAFDVFFDPAFVNTAGIATDFTNTIFGTAGVNYTKIEDRSEISTGRFSVGITRFNTTPIVANGGTVMKLTLPMKSGGPQGLFKVTVIPLTCNDQAGNELLITGTADSLIVGSLNACTTNTWTGTISAAWENAGNWSCGSIPGASTIVNISAGTPFTPNIKSAAICKKLNLLQGATIKVDPGYKLDIVGVN